MDGKTTAFRATTVAAKRPRDRVGTARGMANLRKAGRHAEPYRPNLRAAVAERTGAGFVARGALGRIWPPLDARHGGGSLMPPTDTPRLLPWPSADGTPCFLVGDGTGYISRIADEMEAAQLDSAGELIEEACRILAARTWTPGEIHLLAVELLSSLVDVRRVAESRGARLPVPDDDRPDADEGPSDHDINGEKRWRERRAAASGGGVRMIRARRARRRSRLRRKPGVTGGGTRAGGSRTGCLMYVRALPSTETHPSTEIEKGEADAHHS